MDKKSTTLLNVTPTEAEKQLYQYAGFYIVEKDRAGTDAEYLKYAVCHSNQLRVEEGETFMRPPHFHILMKAVRKRTKKELAMLQEG